MPGPRVSNKHARDLQRAVHLVAGLLIVAYLYTPIRDLPIVLVVVQVVVVPVLAASGLALWQWPRLRRLLSHARASVAHRQSDT